MIAESVFALFPAVPLAIAALNFRYVSIAGLMRDLSAQMEKGGSVFWAKDIITDEIRILKRRIFLVKASLFFTGIAFISNLLALYAVSIADHDYAHVGLTAAIAMLIFAMLCFCAETILSTKALNLHISKLKP